MQRRVPLGAVNALASLLFRVPASAGAPRLARPAAVVRGTATPGTPGALLLGARGSRWLAAPALRRAPPARASARPAAAVVPGVAWGASAEGARPTSSAAAAAAEPVRGGAEGGEGPAGPGVSSSTGPLDVVPAPGSRDLCRTPVPSTAYAVLNFYHFAEVPNPAEEKARHIEFLRSCDFKGRVYISHQGINVQAGGATGDAERYARWVCERPGSPFFGARYALYPATSHVFPRLKVKHRKLLGMSAGIGSLDITDPRNRATPLPPARWAAGAARDLRAGLSPVILDLRNGYEWDAGHFAGASRPTEEEFRETPMGIGGEGGRPGARTAYILSKREARQREETAAAERWHLPAVAGGAEGGVEGEAEAGDGESPMPARDDRLTDKAPAAVEPPTSLSVPVPLHGLPKSTPVYMYCTGGIRCDAYSVHLRDMGYENLFTLEGGVQTYAEQAKTWGGEERDACASDEAAGEESREAGDLTISDSCGPVAAAPTPAGPAVPWIGSLYVFDARMATRVPNLSGNPLREKPEEDGAHVCSGGHERGEAHDCGSAMGGCERGEVQEGLPAAVTCYLCESALATLPHVNCANVDCNRLFVACASCRAAMRGACSEACLDAPRLLRPPLVEGNYGNWGRYTDRPKKDATLV